MRNEGKAQGCANTHGLGDMNHLQMMRHHHSETIILQKLKTMRTRRKFTTRAKNFLNEIKGAL